MSFERGIDRAGLQSAPSPGGRDFIKMQFEQKTNCGKIFRALNSDPEQER
jgi:hypothetical protein